MNKTPRGLYPVVLAFSLVVFTGCGKKPAPPVPVTITAERVLQAIEKRAEHINDFSGRAYAAASIRGVNQDAIVYINYRKPDRYRAILKGAFGVVIAVLTGEGDSVTVYVPSLKGYFVVGSDDSDLLGALVPDLALDFSHFTSVVTGLKGLINQTPTSSLSRLIKDGKSHISLERVRNRAVVTIENGVARYRYTVEGPDLLLVEEEYSRGGELVMRIGYSDYADCGDIRFPRKITMSDTVREVKLNFSSCSINSGLSDSDLSFELPQNADRLTIQKTE